MPPWLCIRTAEVKDEDIHTLAAWPNLFFFLVFMVYVTVCVCVCVCDRTHFFLMGFSRIHSLVFCFFFLEGGNVL